MEVNAKAAVKPSQTANIALINSASVVLAINTYLLTLNASCVALKLRTV